MKYRIVKQHNLFRAEQKFLFFWHEPLSKELSYGVGGFRFPREFKTEEEASAAIERATKRVIKTI